MILELIFTQAIAQSNISTEVIDDLDQSVNQPISEDYNESENSNVTQLPEESVPEDNRNYMKPRKIDRKKSKVIKNYGNLDHSLIRSKTISEIKTPVQIPKNTNYQKDSKLLAGTKFKVLINSDIIAYSNSKSPIEATVLEGDYTGSVLLGNATMDVQTKRVFIDFTSLKKRFGHALYSLNGVVRDKTGEIGLSGNHESFYWNYFLAETVLNTAGGFADATTERSRNFNGQFEIKPSIDSSTKQGLASGLSKSADRIGEKLRSAPEYVTAKGPFVVQVLITE